jgi:hypothetical protein
MRDTEVHGFQARVNRKEDFVGSIPEMMLGRPIRWIFLFLSLRAGRGAQHDHRHQNPGSLAVSHEDRLGTQEVAQRDHVGMRRPFRSQISGKSANRESAPHSAWVPSITTTALSKYTRARTPWVVKKRHFAPVEKPNHSCRPRLVRLRIWRRLLFARVLGLCMQAYEALHRSCHCYQIKWGFYSPEETAFCLRSNSE